MASSQEMNVSVQARSFRLGFERFSQFAITDEEDMQVWELWNDRPRGFDQVAMPFLFLERGHYGHDPGVRWQAELAAFGWRDGRVEGVGEHDDVVVASWYVELAVRAVVRWLATEPEEIVTMEDLGIERVRIGPDF